MLQIALGKLSRRKIPLKSWTMQVIDSYYVIFDFPRLWLKLFCLFGS